MTETSTPVEEGISSVQPGDLAALLQECREKAGLGVDQAAEEMHLSVSILRSLETEDFARLPEPPYIRGYLRGYAKLADKDPKQLIRLYEVLRGANPDDIAHHFAPKRPIHYNNQQGMSPLTLKIIGLVGIGLLVGLVAMVPGISDWTSSTWKSFSAETNLAPVVRPAPALDTFAAQQAAADKASAAASTAPVAPATATATPVLTATATASAATPDAAAPVAAAPDAVSPPSTPPPVTAPTASALPSVSSTADTAATGASAATSITPTATATPPAASVAAAASTKPAAPAVPPVATTPTATVATATPTTASPTATAATAAPTTVATPATTDAAAAGTDQMQPIVGEANVKLEFTEGTWMQVKAGDKKTVYEALNSAGATQEFKATPPLRFKVGNAKGVKITINGQLFDQTPHTKGSVARFDIK